MWALLSVYDDTYVLIQDASIATDIASPNIYNVICFIQYSVYSVCMQPLLSVYYYTLEYIASTAAAKTVAETLLILLNYKYIKNVYQKFGNNEKILKGEVPVFQTPLPI
jgi:riboflavin transporter FmnP